MKTLMALILVVIAIGCASTKIPDIKGPKSKLIIDNQSVVELYAYIFIDPINCKEMRPVGSAKAGEKIEIEFASDAKSAYMLGTTTMSGSTIRNCFAIASFTPEKGKNYRTIYSLGASEFSLSLLSNIANDRGSPEQPALFKKQIYKLPFRANQGFCVN